jgi:hypothetical protein
VGSNPHPLLNNIDKKGIPMKLPANPVWDIAFSDDLVSVWQNSKDNIHFKVKIKNGKTKQFYNETAWSDVPRYLADETGFLKYWSVLD